MLIKKNIEIRGSKSKPILIDTFYNDDKKAKPIIIFSHGFKGFKDWGHFNELAKTCAEKNFVFIKFNFSYNGTSKEKPDEFVDLEAFGANNYLIELDDLGLVIDWALNDALLKNNINKNLLYLIGHSRGGGVSIIKAAEDTRVKKLVTWASVSSFTHTPKQLTLDTWKKDGVIYAANSRTKQNMPMYYQFYETILNNQSRLNIYQAVKHLQIPYLIIHGNKDEAVDLSAANELKRSCKNGELFIVDQANHSFGIKHPFDGILTEHAKIAFEKTINFFL
jgi:fermentation-respiration switch protein FrsA (DUF1100 family)